MLVEEKKSKLKSVAGDFLPDDNRGHQLPCSFFSSAGGTEVGLINADVTDDTTLQMSIQSAVNKFPPGGTGGKAQRRATAQMTEHLLGLT